MEYGEESGKIANINVIVIFLDLFRKHKYTLIRPTVQEL
jgi:hypothetical protein